MTRPSTNLFRDTDYDSGVSELLADALYTARQADAEVLFVLNIIDLLQTQDVSADEAIEQALERLGL